MIFSRAIVGTTIRRVIFAVGLITIMAWCGKAEADSIIYTISGIGTGALGGQAFFNAAFTFTSTADTSQITNPMPGIFIITDLTATVSVSSIGSGVFTIPTANVVNQSIPAVTIGAPIQNATIVSVDGNVEFANYDLSTSLGPLTSEHNPGFNTNLGYATTAGDISFLFVYTTTFQAEIVPEPTVFSLFGLISFGFVFRPRKLVMPLDRTIGSNCSKM